MGVGLGMMNVETVTGSQVNDFKSSMIKILEKEENPYLNVDYHPSANIAKPLRDAGITTSNAPWKTRMTFNNDGVQVSYGYGAKLVEL